MFGIPLMVAGNLESGRRWSPELVAALLIFATAVLIRLPYFGDPAPDYDEQLYSLVGQRMLTGATPYVDIWDRKPIGIFMVFAFAHWLGGPGPFAYQALAMASAGLGGWLVFRLARNFGGIAPSLIAAGLYLLNLGIFGAAIGQSEVFYIPLMLLMLAVLIDIYRTSDLNHAIRRAILLMALGGFALQIKYTVAPQCFFFGIATLWRLWQLGMKPARLVGSAGLFGLIGIFPTALIALYYAAIGHGQEFLYANFLSIFSRGDLTGSFATDYKMRVALSALPLTLLALAGVHRIYRQGQGNAAYVLVLAWTAAALCGFLMVGNIYVHYFAPVVPGLILLAVPLFAGTEFGQRVGLVALIGATIAYGFQWQIPHARSNEAAITKLTALAQPYVDGKHRCLYVFDGPTALYDTTGSCVLTRFVYPDHLSNSMEAPALGLSATDEVKRLLAARPAVIITASEPIVPHYNAETARAVNDAVARDYETKGSAFFFPRMLYVNVRRDLTVH